MTQAGFYTPPILNPVNYCMLTKLWQVRWKYFGLTRKLNIWRWHNWNWSHLIFVTYATYDVGVKFSCSCKKNPKMWKGKSLSKAMQKITKPRCFVLHSVCNFISNAICDSALSFFKYRVLSRIYALLGVKFTGLIMQKKLKNIKYGIDPPVILCMLIKWWQGWYPINVNIILC